MKCRDENQGPDRGGHKRKRSETRDPSWLFLPFQTSDCHSEIIGVARAAGARMIAVQLLKSLCSVRMRTHMYGGPLAVNSSIVTSYWTVSLYDADGLKTRSLLRAYVRVGLV